MKVVYFRQILFDCVTKQWTAAQQIVYSHLLSQSVIQLGNVFENKKVKGEKVKHIDYVSVIEDFRDEYGRIELCKFSMKGLSKSLNFSRQTIYNCLELIRLSAYIDDDGIYFPKEMLNNGYFELQMKSGLTKELLIFYSWLVERSRDYGGYVDAYSDRIAELYGVESMYVRQMIHRLSEKGWVKRIKDERKNRYGKLLIIKPKQ